MKKFKENWEITRNWQLIYPVLGVLLSAGFGFLIARRITGSLDPGAFTIVSLLFLTLISTYLIIKISLYCFKKLKNRWELNARWEFIAVFIVFAITGSTAGRISSPVMEAIGLGSDALSGWIYWPLRLILIFPLYQILLLIVAWLLGQYRFFWLFEKKMLSRMGLGFFFK